MDEANFLIRPHIHKLRNLNLTKLGQVCGYFCFSFTFEVLLRPEINRSVKRNIVKSKENKCMKGFI